MYLRDKIDTLLNFKRRFGLMHLAAYYRLFYYGKEFVVENKLGDFQDKIFYVIRVRHNEAGVMAYARWVTHKCAEADKRGMIPVVDMRDGTNLYIDKKDIGKINVWEYYFKQPCGYTLDEIKNAAHIVYSSLDNDFPDFQFSDKIKKIVKKHICFSDKIDNMAENFIKKYRGGAKA